MGMPVVPALTLWPRVRTWLPGLALAAVLGCIVGILAGNVWIGTGFTFDQPAMIALHGLASPWLTAAMRAVTASASGLVVVGLALALASYWWRWAEQRAEAVVLLVSLAGSAALGQGLKALFARPRPEVFPWLATAGGWSFPSGHTLTTLVLGGLLAWLIGRRLSAQRRVALWIVAGLWAGLVSLSQVYLGVHYPSDVLASLAVGGLCLLAAQYSYEALDSQSPT